MGGRTAEALRARRARRALRVRVGLQAGWAGVASLYPGGARGRCPTPSDCTWRCLAVPGLVWLHCTGFAASPSQPSSSSARLAQAPHSRLGGRLQAVAIASRRGWPATRSNPRLSRASQLHVGPGAAVSSAVRARTPPPPPTLSLDNPFRFSISAAYETGRSGSAGRRGNSTKFVEREASAPVGAARAGREGKPAEARPPRRAGQGALHLGCTCPARRPVQPWQRSTHLSARATTASALPLSRRWALAAAAAGTAARPQQGPTATTSSTPRPHPRARDPWRPLRQG